MLINSFHFRKIKRANCCTPLDLKTCNQQQQLPTIPPKYQSRKLMELNRQIHAHGGWSDQISKNKDLKDILTIIYKLNTVDVDRILYLFRYPQATHKK